METSVICIIANTVSGLFCLCRQRPPDEFKLPTDEAALVPEQHRYLAMTLKCNHPAAQRLWHDQQALALARGKEAYHKDLIPEGVHMHVAWKTLAEQHLNGTHVTPPRHRHWVLVLLRYVIVCR